MYTDKRQEFRARYNWGQTNIDTLCRNLLICKRIVTKWIIEDFPNEAQSAKIKTPPPHQKSKPDKKRKQHRTGWTHTRLKPVRERFIKLYDTRKYTLADLAKMLEVNRGTLHNWRKQFFPEGNNNWRYTRFCQFHEAGISAREIATLLDCNYATSLKYLRRYEAENKKPEQNTVNVL